MLNKVKWVDFKTINDERGLLTAIESGLDIPIEIKRIFYMHKVTAGRGGHAHIDTDQVIISMHDSFKVTLSDGSDSQTYILNDANKGLYVPRMIFTDLLDFSDESVCLVLANTNYDINKSIRSWDSYLKYINPILGK
jgi:dTDP-4-dehydrorhamnose 3,5-epimerase-like enzyme